MMKRFWDWLREPREADTGLFAWVDVRTARTPRVFLASLSALAVVILIWSCVADFDRVVRGVGRVVPTENTQIVQHLEGGIVSEIVASEGQLVRKGDLLIRLRDTDASSALTATESKGLGLKAKIARLQAEAVGAGSIRIPEGMTESTPEMAAEISAFRARRLFQGDNNSAERARYQQKVAEIGEAEQKLSNYRVEHETAEKQLQVMTNLRNQHAASQIELLDAQAKEQRLSSLIHVTEALLPSLQAAAREALSRSSQSSAQIRAEAQSELTAAELELTRETQDARGQADRLTRTEVRAPMDGVVNHIFIHTIGGVTRPGEPLVELTPVGGDLVVEGRIKPGERGELHPGLTCSVKINAYDYADLGVLAAKLTDISADTIADEKGERYYRIKVSVSKNLLKQARKPIYPGMTTTVDIVVGGRKVIEYILSPLLHFSQKAFREAK